MKRGEILLDVESKSTLQRYVFEFICIKFRYICTVDAYEYANFESTLIF